MPPGPKRKVTLYFSNALLDETQREAIRQDRSISWVIQAAWRHAREEIRRLPGSVPTTPASTTDRTAPEQHLAPVMSASPSRARQASRRALN